MDFHSKYYILTGGELLGFAKSFRSQSIKISVDTWDYVVSLGADAYKRSHSGNLLSVRLKNNSPTIDFKKEGRDGFRSPYKKSEMYKKFQEFRTLDCRDGVKSITQCPSNMSYKTKDGSRSTRIGDPFFPFQICWYSDSGPILAVLPDVERAVNEALSRDDFVEFDGFPDKWEFNDLFGREIIKEEWDFMAAKYKRDNK